jgi:DTW domain-containing protein YfiP
MATASRIVLLTHPKEYRRQKTGTGRLACLNLANCESLPGIAFDDHPRVRELSDDPANRCYLLYPSPGAVTLSGSDGAGLGRAGTGLSEGRIVVFMIDSTWACSRAVLRESPGISRLPRIRLEPREPSRWRIKRQPRANCLATIEAIHELLCVLEAAGLESYPDKLRLLDAFAALQDYQIARAEASGSPRFTRP